MMSLTVGQKARRSATLTADHVRVFSELTGDFNPLHNDPAFTGATRFKRLIVQSGLTTGLVNAIVAMDLPGPGTVFLSHDWRFTNPVFIGDTITAEVEVLKVHATKPVTHLAVRITRQDGETVLEGEVWCYTARPGQA
jgi:acyl dehydratase